MMQDAETGTVVEQEEQGPQEVPQLARQASQRGWYTPKTTRKTLDSFGHPEFWFEGMDLNSLPYKVMEPYLERLSVIQEGGEEATATIASLVVELISDWNLTHPSTGERLPPPSEDPDSFRELPGEIVFEMIKLLSGTAANVPPQRGSRR